VEWEFGVKTTETGDKMILVGADGTFGGVASMASRGCKLEINIVGPHEGLEQFGTFVVQALELRTEACVAEFRVHGFVCNKEGLGSTCLEWFGKNVIAVIIIHNHQVVVAIA